MTDDYETRAKDYGFPLKETIIEALKNPDTYILDVRGQSEIAVQGKLDSARWVQVEGCTLNGCEALESDAESLLSDKEGTYSSFV
jgi:hypothetical protein